MCRPCMRVTCGEFMCVVYVDLYVWTVVWGVYVGGVMCGCARVCGFMCVDCGIVGVYVGGVMCGVYMCGVCVWTCVYGLWCRGVVCVEWYSGCICRGCYV